MCVVESALSQKSFSPLPLEGADERSEAGLVSPNEGAAFHAANLRPFGASPSKGRREKEGRIGHRRYERQMRKAERCAAYVEKREALIAKDNDLISVS